MSDLHCTLSALHLHPVKSCGGFEVRESLLVETGLDLDRAWMVVDDRGEMLTQRELPRMALVQTSLRHDDVVLRAPGMLPLHLAINAVEEPTRVQVWDDIVKAYDMGGLAAQWFSDFLGQPKLRQVRFDLEGRVRLAERRLWHEGLVMDTGRLVMKTGGSVGADGSLAMTAELAFRGDIVGQTPVIAQLLRTPLVIPLRGTVHRPQFDAGQIDTILGRIVENTAEAVINDGLSRGLEALFGKPQ